MAKTNTLTPVMQQYIDLKNKNEDAVLFFRLGDFYEVFFDDAVQVAKELELTLTKRNSGLNEPAKMCGVPYHSVDPYISKLIDKGYKVAIAEQMTDPSASKGLVERQIVRIVTKGTDTSNLSSDRNNYLACAYQNIANIALVYTDISTGEIRGTTIIGRRRLLDEIAKIRPSQLICNDKIYFDEELMHTFRNIFDMQVERKTESFFDEHESENMIKTSFNVASPSSLGVFDKELVLSLGSLLQYLQNTNPISLNGFFSFNIYKNDTFMKLDSSTIRNLEINETIKDKSKNGSLLGVLDKTKTAMGARKLRRFLEEPLIDENLINTRLDAVEILLNDSLALKELQGYLNTIYDIERTSTRILHANATPKDLLALKQSFANLPAIKNLIADFDVSFFREISTRFDALEDIYTLIDTAIDEDAPNTIKDGGIFKSGYNGDIDELRDMTRGGRQFLANLESKEREATGIKKLKIKYNKVFGYFFEVTNSYLDLVPDYFIRKQTMTGCERYFTEELKNMESSILGAKEKLISLENYLFTSLSNDLISHLRRFKLQADIISEIDAIASFADVSILGGFVKPSINTDGVIEINDGRHPVVEKLMNSELFIPNDTYLDCEEKRFSIITGPNMAGKSTYMRQVAIITLMAQVGCFVPASSANISVVDRIFTRVGASDDLSAGRSTFMVEMIEVANIVRNATKNSLIILDEIGRGTSTFDGLSIAWAVVEFISNKASIGAKTLFATHYHELTELEGKVDGVLNYSVDVSEDGEDIIFLRKIIRGSAMKSYGIEVARLAGVPQPVLMRSKEILAELNKADITRTSEAIMESASTNVQSSIFDDTNSEIVQTLKELNIDDMTPMQAMSTLNELKKMI